MTTKCKLISFIEMECLNLICENAIDSIVLSHFMNREKNQSVTIGILLQVAMERIVRKVSLEFCGFEMPANYSIHFCSMVLSMFQVLIVIAICL